ncbi:MAG: twin arginine-targeting protein translocase TatC [Actinobacteria bacterium 13_2_20CM_2_72_6]|nr:MAG: twin arginine-targeting protein translocase TatC [Actinobacteria bacterium 13_2_20CM_2_72_6]
MLPRRRRANQFERAADGSMTLLEHLRELRSRLFKASLAVLAGMILGFIVSGGVLDFITHPYCELMRTRPSIAPPGGCALQQTELTEVFTLRMQIALWIGLILASPIWLYQLWAFVAPGLHRHERRWAYWFAGIAAPLFSIGTVLAYFVVAKGMGFLLDFTPKNVVTLLTISKYVKFITNFMLLFGVAFEFPLVVVLFNVAGIASAKRLLGWWRVAIFVFFAFSAIMVPTPDPIGMSLMGLSLSALYFGAVLFAFVNDKRRERAHRAEYGDIDDDEMSPLEYDPDHVEAGPPVESIEPVAPARPIARSYDDMT